MIKLAIRMTGTRARPSAAGAMIAVSVKAPSACAKRCNLGATHTQLMRKPPRVAGSSHSAW